MKANINTQLLGLSKPLSFFKLDPKNARAHGSRSIQAIKDSLTAFGQQKPVVCLQDGKLVAGNGTLVAAKELGWEQLAAVVFKEEAKARAFAIADNRSAELSEWDQPVLLETLSELKLDGLELASVGFTLDDLSKLQKTGSEPATYSSRLDTPVYTPKGEKPAMKALTDMTKTGQLVERIKRADVTDEERDFLLRAAGRHVVFDYQAIAEYYCHATPQMQELMEDSALVIIDFNKAVENGYVVLSTELEKIYKHSSGANNAEG